MTHTFVSLTNRKVAIEKIVVGHSRKPIDQERSIYPRRRMDWGVGYMQNHSREATVAQSQSRSGCYPILLKMHIHSHEATDTVTPFDEYAESQSWSDCYVTPTRRSR